MSETTNDNKIVLSLLNLNSIFANCPSAPFSMLQRQEATGSSEYFNTYLGGGDVREIGGRGC